MDRLPTFAELNQFFNNDCDKYKSINIGIPQNYNDFKSGDRYNRFIRTLAPLKSNPNIYFVTKQRNVKPDNKLPLYLGGNDEAIYLCILRDITNHCAGDFDHITILKSSWDSSQRLHLTLDLSCSTIGKNDYICSQYLICSIDGNHKPILNPDYQSKPSKSSPEQIKNNSPTNKRGKQTGICEYPVQSHRKAPINHY